MDSSLFFSNRERIIESPLPLFAPRQSVFSSSHRRFDPRGDSRGTTTGFYFNVRPLFSALRFRYPFTPRRAVCSRSRGNRGKISFSSVDWTTGETRGLVYGSTNNATKTWGDRGDSFSSILRSESLLTHLSQHRRLSIRHSSNSRSRANEDSEKLGVQKRFINDAWSNRTLLIGCLAQTTCRRNVAIGTGLGEDTRNDGEIHRPDHVDESSRTGASLFPCGSSRRPEERSTLCYCALDVSIVTLLSLASQRRPSFSSFLKSLGPRERDDIDRGARMPRTSLFLSIYLSSILSRSYLVSLSQDKFFISGDVGSTVKDLARGT